MSYCAILCYRIALQRMFMHNDWYLTFQRIKKLRKMIKTRHQKKPSYGSKH